MISSLYFCLFFRSGKLGGKTPPEPRHHTEDVQSANSTRQHHFQPRCDPDFCEEARLTLNTGLFLVEYQENIK